MTIFRFASVGDNCIDRFQPPLAQSLVGGNAVNVAVQLARLGQSSSYFGAVGADRDGTRTRELLAENGVDVAHLHSRAGITAYTDIAVLASGERVIGHEDFGVCAGYRPDRREIDILKSMDHVHIGWMDDGGELRRTLAAAGVSLSQDISVNADPANLGVAGLAIAFGSAGEDEAAAEAMITAFLAQGAGIAVVTCGARGAMADNGGTRARTGIRPVEVVDTTGAGDSFIAGFIAAHVGGLSLSGCLEAGRDQAAATCGHIGGFPQVPHPL